MRKLALTPKQLVLKADPKARLDFYEALRGAGKPCWFIRHGWQGLPLSDICISPRAAWREAYRSLKESFAEAYEGKAVA